MRLYDSQTQVSLKRQHEHVTITVQKIGFVHCKTRLVFLDSTYHILNEKLYLLEKHEHIKKL